MEEALKRLQDETPIDLPCMEPEYPPALVDCPEMRFGFRRGWHECEDSYKAKLKHLFNAYSTWRRDPDYINVILNAVNTLMGEVSV